MNTTVALSAAAGSALCYGGGSVLEQIGARRERPGLSLDPRLVLRLARQLPWLAGAALDVGGWALSLAALRSLPLFAVQAAVAASIGVTALLSAVLFDIRPDRRQCRALVALGIGLLLLGAAAAPDGPGQMPGALRAVLVVGPIGLAVVAAPMVWSARGDAGAARLGCLAGLAFSGTAIAGRVLEVPAAPAAVLADPLAWSLAAYGLLGTVLFALALQRGSATSAAAALFAVETVIPAIVGVVLLGDRTRPALAPLAAAGFVATVSSVVLLARRASPG